MKFISWVSGSENFLSSLSQLVYSQLNSNGDLVCSDFVGLYSN